MTWQPIETAPKDGTVVLPLTRGQVTIIDASDLCLVERHTWHATPRRDGKGLYAKNTAGTRMHRLLLGIWDKRIVDHIDGDGLNNRRENIRVGTQALNCVNRRTTPTSHLRGAYPRGSRWRAMIKDGGRYRSLGYFQTELEAHAAYRAEAIRLHGDWYPRALPEPPNAD